MGQKIICLGLLVLGQTGCGVLGIREIQLGEFKTTFAEGIDFHVGTNMIDHVEDKRGVEPHSREATGQERLRQAVSNKY